MKKTTSIIAIAALFLLSTCLSYAQKKITDSADGYKIAATIDHDNSLYHCGEEIKVSVSLTLNGEPADGKLTYFFSKDFYAPSKTHTKVDTENGKYELSYTAGEPGFVNFKFTYKTPGGATIYSIIGAGVDPYDIKRSMPVPEDFHKYWKQQKELQAKVPVNIRLEKVESKVPGVTAYDVQADCVAGNFSGYLAIPDGCAAGSLPAMVMCHGAGIASSRLSVATKWAKNGIVVLDFNVHGLPNGQPREYYRDLQQGELKQYYLYDTSDRDALFFRSMIFRLMRAFDIVTDRPEWDGKRLIAFGRSQGGAQALIAGGLDPRIGLVCAEIPALCDVTGYAVHRMAGWPKWPIIDAEGNITDETALNSIRYVDAINFVPDMKAKCYMTVGYVDQSCCATGVFAVYNEVPTEKHMYHHKYKGHTQTPEGDEFVRNAVLEYIGK